MEHKQMVRTRIDGYKEVLTETEDRSGKVSTRFCLQTSGSEEVTLQEDEALIQGPDSVRYFKLINGAYELKERLIFSPNKVKSVDTEEESQLEHDLALIKSASLMFEEAKTNRDQFKLMPTEEE